MEGRKGERRGRKEGDEDGREGREGMEGRRKLKRKNKKRVGWLEIKLIDCLMNLSFMKIRDSFHLFLIFCNKPCLLLPSFVCRHAPVASGSEEKQGERGEGREGGVVVVVAGGAKGKGKRDMARREAGHTHAHTRAFLFKRCCSFM
jgi:hypothetical protein